VPQTTTAQTNIETITRLEDEAETDRSIAERTSETIGRFAGTMSFVLIQLCFVGLWIGINLGSSAFDPFPFSLLSVVLSFECVMLTAFILIRQNRMNLQAHRRSHLALQINLLSEQEATKIIQMLERMSRQMGIEAAVTDSETKELAANTSIDGIARDLRESLGAETKPKA
jgi:uncharacterized membrane protein